MIDEVLTDAEERMQKSIDTLRRDLGGIRTGRASTGLIERLDIDYYGTVMPLNQLANISAPEAHLLVVQPWDKSATSAIERALRTSELGLNPSSDGQVIRIAIPPLTEERRKSLVKLVRHTVEDNRVAIRNIRRDALAQIKEMLHEKMIGEDEERRAEHQVDELTKRYVSEAEKIGKHKEGEVLEF